MAIKKTNSVGLVHVAATIGIAVTLGLVSWFVYIQVKHQQAVSAERKLYAQADKEARDFIASIESGFSGKVMHDNGCSRASAKYSEGSLSCRVGSSIEVTLDKEFSEADILSLANNKLSVLNWGAPRDGTTGNQEYTSPYYIKSLIYNLEDKKCGVHYRYKDDGSSIVSPKLILNNGHKILVIDAGCSGSALAEYY